MQNKKVLCRNKNMVSRNIAGETILIPVYKSSDEINCIYTLNKAAAWLWEKIDGRKALGRLKKEAADYFASGKDEIDKKLTRLIEELEEIKALA